MIFLDARKMVPDNLSSRCFGGNKAVVVMPRHDVLKRGDVFVGNKQCCMMKS